ncbi:MAG: 1-acyl-sn-glycerol-3-phosphate acyltransferase [Sulfurimonas sp.]|uniref:lysophospholipid acyltransferase family protein n=1 Tax=Sulfurimonas sp. TaxID=2022749 RepID=UPI00263346F8|nr:lysophospholipid acyltransferase family protein [Sulfurimonas sp.]MCW8894208.1 1-acyl-sn-glycerol-3-phosphate acyltransferase [Sulfurimonas sp.]MCW8953360.1 1-acyl-sn-glycerol-3-phosphate acyltransferase [Sulfurimonas sp.]MCW9067270.1 1-acyl-sn-glycerol-3-phosphate acyltransferase [Sulfurimonas sp.]
MTFNQIKIAIYSLYLTNYYGFKLSGVTDSLKRKKARISYANQLLNKLNIKIKVINKEKLPQDGQYLLASNHRTIIDPLIVEVATQYSNIHGDWIAKKELYNSFFFGKFTRNLGTILLDREASQMSGFFKDIKESVKNGNSIYIFPEGTRNKSDSPISEFKEGAQIIAIKNRLPILPVYIRSKANDILKEAIKDSRQQRIIEIEIGNIIDYKDRSLSFEEAYKKQFNIA